MNLSFSDIFRQMRPSWWPALWAHFMAGAILALGWSGLRGGGVAPMSALLAGGLWTVCLGGSASLLTAAFEPGEEAQRGADGGPYGLALMLVGLPIAATISWDYFDMYLVGMALTVAYAVPPVRLARFGASSAAVEMIGPAMLTFYAGYVSAGRGHMHSPEQMLYPIGFGFMYLAVRSRISITPRKVARPAYAGLLAAAIICLLAAEAWTGARLQLALFLAPVAAWYFLAPGEGISGALTAWVVTDAAVALAAILR